MRNGPNISSIANLLLQSEVLVWREKGYWDGPFKLIGKDDRQCTISMPNGPRTFKITSIKPYYCDAPNASNAAEATATRTRTALNPRRPAQVVDSDDDVIVLDRP